MMTMMARPRLRSLGQDPPFPPTPTRWCHRSVLRLQPVACRTLPLYSSPRRAMFVHEGFRAAFFPSIPSAGLLCGLAPPFERHANPLHLFLEAPHLVLLLSRGVDLTPNQLPKHHSPV